MRLSFNSHLKFDTGSVKMYTFMISYEINKNTEKTSHNNDKT